MRFGSKGFKVYFTLFIAERIGDKNTILFLGKEIGNVLSHHVKFEHDVLDKYKIAKDVINEDIVDFKSDKKYDLESGNEWKEALWEDVQDARYNTPFPFANGLLIGIIAVKPEV